MLNLSNNKNIQATLSVFRLVKNMSINAKSVEFHQCHAKPHSICFLHNIKDNERNLCHNLLTIENTNSDLKMCTRCIMQMSYLYASDFPFKNFCKLAQHGETIRKKMFKTTDHDKPHFHSYVFMLFTTISTSKKMCFFFLRPERELKKALRDTLTPAAWYGL